MASPKSKGRMLRKSVSESEKIASLSTEAAVLFFMLIPFFNSHGKMSAGPGVIKDEIVPLIQYFTYENLPIYLQEISDKTNVKWFKRGSKWWLHSLNFLSEHQELRADKLGSDDLPSFSCEQVESSPGVVPDLPSRGEVRSLKLEVRSKEGGKSEEEVCFEEAHENVEVTVELPETPPPPDPENPPVFYDEQVSQVKVLHLKTCGLGSMPPLDLVRVILRRGILLQKILDVYQTFGGDPMRYRQRNITERLIDLREGRERSPPRRSYRQGMALATAKQLLADGPPGESRDDS